MGRREARGPSSGIIFQVSHPWSVGTHTELASQTPPPQPPTPAPAFPMRATVSTRPLARKRAQRAGARSSGVHGVWVLACWVRAVRAASTHKRTGTRLRCTRTHTHARNGAAGASRCTHTTHAADRGHDVCVCARVCVRACVRVRVRVAAFACAAQCPVAGWGAARARTGVCSMRTTTACPRRARTSRTAHKPKYAAPRLRFTLRARAHPSAPAGAPRRFGASERARLGLAYACAPARACAASVAIKRWGVGGGEDPFSSDTGACLCCALLSRLRASTG